MKYPPITTSALNTHIGTVGAGCSNYPEDNGLVTTGACREDWTDPVYGVDPPFTTCTHFWNSDAGDEGKIYDPSTTRELGHEL